MVSFQAPAVSLRGNKPGTLERDVFWVRELVWTFLGRKCSLVSAEIRTLDRPSRSLVTVLTKLSRVRTSGYSSTSNVQNTSFTIVQKIVLSVKRLLVICTLFTGYCVHTVKVK